MTAKQPTPQGISTDFLSDDIPEAPPGTFDNAWSDEPPAVLQPGREYREAVARAMTPDAARTAGPGLARVSATALHPASVTMTGRPAGATRAA